MISAFVQRADDPAREPGKLTPAQLGDVKQALGWTDRRVVDVIPIRPAAELRGNSFAGFLDADLRREYLDVGYLRGLEELGGLGWGLRADQPEPARHEGGVPPAIPPGAVVNHLPGRNGGRV